MIKKPRKKRVYVRTVYTDQRLVEIKSILDKYTDETEIPILKEACYLNNLDDNKLYEFDLTRESIKRMMRKKEAGLERLGLKSMNTMAIFSLKQLGWKDKQDINVNNTVKVVKDDIL